MNEHRVEYIIVGAYALAYHGAPRFTGDIDVYVHPTPENARRILHALVDFGFFVPNLTVEDFQKPNKVIQLGVPLVRVVLVMSITGVPWEDANAHKGSGLFGDIPVHYLGREQYIINQRAIGRKKDLADLEAFREK